MKIQDPTKYTMEKLGIEKSPQGETKNQSTPLSYRLVLKLPNLSLEGFSDKFQGYFWMLIPPAFVYLNFWVVMLLFGVPAFPFNVISVLLYAGTAAALLIRIHVERELNTRQALLEQEPFPWNVSKAFKEYVDILEKSKRKSHCAERRQLASACAREKKRYLLSERGGEKI